MALKPEDIKREPAVFARSRNRWYTNEEVASILTNFNSHPNWLIDELQVRPKSGAVLLYSREKVRYRQDGYCWKKRKNGRTTREDHMKLKVQGIECIYGCYVHSAILPTFHRRCYWLLQNPDIVLVHYLNQPPDDQNKMMITFNPSLLEADTRRSWTNEEIIEEIGSVFGGISQIQHTLNINFPPSTAIIHQPQQQQHDELHKQQQQQQTNEHHHHHQQQQQHQQQLDDQHQQHKLSTPPLVATSYDEMPQDHEQQQQQQNHHQQDLLLIPAELQIEQQASSDMTDSTMTQHQPNQHQQLHLGASLSPTIPSDNSSEILVNSPNHFHHGSPTYSMLLQQQHQLMIAQSPMECSSNSSSKPSVQSTTILPILDYVPNWCSTTGGVKVLIVGNWSSLLPSSSSSSLSSTTSSTINSNISGEQHHYHQQHQQLCANSNGGGGGVGGRGGSGSGSSSGTSSSGTVEQEGSGGEFFALFHDLLVPATLIQDNVLRCYAPSHEQGFITLKVLYRGQVVSEEVLFEMRPPCIQSETAQSASVYPSSIRSDGGFGFGSSVQSNGNNSGSSLASHSSCDGLAAVHCYTQGHNFPCRLEEVQDSHSN